MGDGNDNDMADVAADGMTIVTASADGRFVIKDRAPRPQLAEDMMLVKVAAVALNPADAKMTGDFVTPGLPMGCDYAGTVVSVGGGVRRAVRPGDRVCGAVVGMDALQPTIGAFASYVGGYGDVSLTVPEGMGFAEAATFGTSLCTVGHALYHTLGLELPRVEDGAAGEDGPAAAAAAAAAATEGEAEGKKGEKEAEYVLVYGGSTATGTTALQLLALSGYKPIAVCSAHNFELARSYGAVATYDYHGAEGEAAAAAVRALTRNELEFALDCIGTAGSTEFCYAAIGRCGGRYATLNPPAEAATGTRRAVEARWVLGVEMLGRDIAWPAPYGRRASAELRRFAEDWCVLCQALLDRGRLRCHPVRLVDGGFAGVLEGLRELREGGVSGQKLVCLVE